MKTPTLLPLMKNESLGSVKYSSLYIDLKKETVKYAPMALRYQNVRDYKSYLERVLPQKSAKTRNINAYEIIRRFHKKGINRLFSSAVKYSRFPRQKNEIFWIEFAQSEKLVKDFTVSLFYKTLADGAIKKEAARAFVTLAFKKRNDKTYYNLKNVISKCGFWDEKKDFFEINFYKPFFSSFCYALYKEFGETKFGDSRLSKCLTKKILLLDNLTFENYVHTAVKKKLAEFDYVKRSFSFKLNMNEKIISDLIKDEKNS